MKRKRDKTATREVLLESALQLISEKGYLGATTREIAERAGVSEITLFRHFGSKERLFEQLLKQYTFLPRLKDLIPTLEKLPPDEALFRVGMNFFDTLRQRQGLVKIMLSEINIYPEKVRRIYTRFIDEMINTLGKYFRVLQRKGVIRVFEPSMGARAFLGMVFSYFQSEVILQGRSISKRKQSQVIKEYVGFFMKGIGY